ncbi:MAG: creatininase family protein [Holdemania massiliensis]
MYCMETSWPEVQAYFKTNECVMIITGSLECHGVHNPLGVDTLVPQALAQRIEKQSEILVLPALPFGYCDYLKGYPGTVSLSSETLRCVVQEIVDSLRAHGARRFLFLNGHGGNLPALEQVALRLNTQGDLGVIANWWQMADDPAWAGPWQGKKQRRCWQFVRKSYPERYRDSILKPVSENIQTTGFKTVQFHGVTLTMPQPVAALCDNGWTGPDHPQTATAQWGEAMLEAISQLLVQLISELKTVPLKECYEDQ